MQPDDQSERLLQLYFVHITNEIVKHLWCYGDIGLTLFGLQSRFGDKLLGIWLICPPNGAAILQ